MKKETDLLSVVVEQFREIANLEDREFSENEKSILNQYERKQEIDLLSVVVEQIFKLASLQNRELNEDEKLILDEYEKLRRGADNPFIIKTSIGDVRIVSQNA
jgi:hypothetical protein